MKNRLQLFSLLLLSCFVSQVHAQVARQLENPFTGVPYYVPISPSVASMKAAGYSIFGTRGACDWGRNTYAFASQGQQGTRIEYIAPWNCTSIVVGFTNFYNGGPSGHGYGEAPNTNPVYVTASFQLPVVGNTTAVTGAGRDITFNHGVRVGYLDSGILWSDPIQVSLIKGQTYCVTSCASTVIGAQPMAPTATTASFNFNAPTGTGNYYFCVRPIYPGGLLGCQSNNSSAVACVAATTGAAVTLPATLSGSLGYRLYASYTAGNSTYATLTSLGDLVGGVTVNWGGAENTWGTAPLLYGEQTGNGNLAVVGAIAGPTSPNSTKIGYRTVSDGTVAIANLGRGLSTNALTGAFQPQIILGLSQFGGAQKSIAIIGDSKAVKTDDVYGWFDGGWIQRAIDQQTLANLYVDTITPYCGYVKLCASNESASIYADPTYAQVRSNLAALATSIIDEYGINDISVYNRTACQTITSLATIDAQAAIIGQGIIRTTLEPLTSSTDSFATITNQTFTSNTYEAFRRQINNHNRSTAGLSGSSVTSEALFRLASSAYGPASTMTSGDGSTLNFATANIFKQGTEQIYVNGVLKTVTTDYTYGGGLAIGGVNCASYVIFNTAPGNGLTVTANYTTVCGPLALVTYIAGVAPVTFACADQAALMEYNGSGVLTPNGGWWGSQITASAITSTLTAVNNAPYPGIVTDSTQTLTLDQYAGWQLTITADAGTPSAVGQAVTIQANTTAGAFSCTPNFAVAPDVGATYTISRVSTRDGVHPTQQVAKAEAAALTVLLGSIH